MSINALQRTRPLWRFLLNLKVFVWGLAAEGWPLGFTEKNVNNGDTPKTTGKAIRKGLEGTWLCCRKQT
jgi:hypothetical protein